MSIVKSQILNQINKSPRETPNIAQYADSKESPAASKRVSEMKLG